MLLFHLDFTCVEDSSGLPSVISSLYTAYCTCQNHNNNTRTTHQGRQARVCPCCAPATRFIEARPVAPSLPAANTTTNTITHFIRQPYRRHSLRGYSLRPRHCYRRLLRAIVSAPPEALPELHKRWLGCAITEALGHSNGISGARAITSLESETKDNRSLFSTIATELSHA